MRHTQVVGQERGEKTSNHVSQHILAGWRWIRSWRARPNYRTHSKLSAVNTVEIGEGQKMVSHWVSNGTHCPDTRKKLPRGQLSHRWLTPPTHQAPMHPLFDPILTFLDEDRCCSDPALPHKISWRCLCPTCEETPAPCRLPPHIPHCSSRVNWPSWCSETEFADTSHSGWWTKTVNRLDAHRPRRIYGAKYN